jgi:septal ring factor EnvC (AmiA/AmiB activator)
MKISAHLRKRHDQTPSRLFLPRPASLFEKLRHEIDRLRKENKNLRKRAEEDEKRIADFEKKSELLKKLEKELADRDKKIDELEHQLVGRKKDSSNSSKPPSSDGPAAGKRVHPQSKKSGRKPRMGSKVSPDASTSK